MKNFSLRSLLTRLRLGISYDPMRDWLLLLSLSGLALIAIIGWSVWAFTSVVEGNPIGAPSAGGAQVFDRSSLDTIHTIFSDRLNEESKYKNGAYIFSDPSQ